MKNIKAGEYRIYATNERGENFLAISTAGHWRLAKQAQLKSTDEWLFVNDTEYRNGQEAIQDCELY